MREDKSKCLCRFEEPDTDTSSTVIAILSKCYSIISIINESKQMKGCERRTRKRTTIGTTLLRNQSAPCAGIVGRECNVERLFEVMLAVVRFTDEISSESSIQKQITLKACNIVSSFLCCCSQIEVQSTTNQQNISN